MKRLLSRTQRRSMRNSCHSGKLTLNISFFKLQPWDSFIAEAHKEFAWSRVWMNHHEVIDFTVFEFGKRTVYLQSRLCLLTFTLITTCYIYLPLLMAKTDYSFLSGLSYMHCWMFILVAIHQLFEICALVYCYYTIPTCVLVRVHQTPWYFKITWLLHNTVPPNLMACNVMYTLCLSDVAKYEGYFHLMCQVVLTVVIGANVCMTGTPSRLCHIYQPLLLTLIHLLFTFLFPILGYTNAEGDPFVYRNLDWISLLNSIMSSLLWLAITTVCYILCVMICWSRRVIFRQHRKKTRPVYGMEEEEYFPIESDSVHCPDHWKTSNNNFCFKGCLGKESAQTPPYSQLPYDPHESYREADAERNKHLLEDRSFHEGPNVPVLPTSQGADARSHRKSYDVMTEMGRLTECYDEMLADREDITTHLPIWSPAGSHPNPTTGSHPDRATEPLAKAPGGRKSLKLKKLKNALVALRRKQRSRDFGSKKRALRHVRASFGAKPQLPTRIFNVLEQWRRSHGDPADVERQAERGDSTSLGESGTSCSYSGEDSLDEDIESEDNEDEYDLVDDSSSDSVFWK
ncbi:unnamed protein product [Lymnaea stagnalis]|uniref:Uncharacterized protein n=1 Tax=Lymnaea stagnalis TaxID=6523 RepID=A0AAV2I728_LYMST